MAKVTSRKNHVEITSQKVLLAILCTLHFSSRTTRTFRSFLSFVARGSLLLFLPEGGQSDPVRSAIRWKHVFLRMWAWWLYAYKHCTVGPFCTCILIIGAYPLTNSVFSNLTLPSLEITRISKYEFLPTDEDAVSNTNFSQETLRDLVTLLTTNHIVQQLWITVMQLTFE